MPDPTIQAESAPTNEQDLTTDTNTATETAPADITTDGSLAGQGERQTALEAARGGIAWKPYRDLASSVSGQVQAEANQAQALTGALGTSRQASYRGDSQTTDLQQEALRQISATAATASYGGDTQEQDLQARNLEDMTTIANQAQAQTGAQATQDAQFRANVANRLARYQAEQKMGAVGTNGPTHRVFRGDDPQQDLATLELEANRIKSELETQKAQEKANEYADRLYKAVKGLWTDEAEIHQVLTAPDFRSDLVKRAFKKKYPKFDNGDLVEALKNDLSGADQRMAMRQLEFNAAERATELKENLGSWHVHTGKEFVNTIDGMSKAEALEVKAVYERDGRSSLIADVREKLSGEQADQVLKKMHLFDSTQAVISLEEAFDGAIEDTDRIERILNEATPEQKQEIETRYLDMKGRTLASDIIKQVQIGEEQVLGALRGHETVKQVNMLIAASKDPDKYGKVAVGVLKNVDLDSPQGKIFEQTFRELTGKSNFQADIMENFSATDAVKAMDALHAGRKSAKLDAQLFRKAMKDGFLQTDEQAIYDLIASRSIAELREAAKAYNDLYDGDDMWKDVSGELNSSERSIVSTILKAKKKGT